MLPHVAVGSLYIRFARRALNEEFVFKHGSSTTPSPLSTGICLST